MQPLAFNYNPNANVADTCIALAYGCTDATMFNYDVNANTDDGGCEPFVSDVPILQCLTIIL